MFGRVFGRVPDRDTGRDAGEQLREEEGYTLLVVEIESGEAARVSSLPTGVERNQALATALVRGMGEGVGGDGGSSRWWYHIVISCGAMSNEVVDCPSVWTSVDHLT